MKPTNAQLERALELMAKDLLIIKFKGVQMTMYEGKWQGMIKDCSAHYLKQAGRKKK